MNLGASRSADRGSTASGGGGFTNLAVERVGAVLHVTINRPEKLNALDNRTLDEITRVFTSVDDDDDLRVVVLGGAGRAFSAGADLQNPPGRPDPSAPMRGRRHVAETGRRACEAIAACGAATIARTHGHVIGGGVLLALSCDFRIGAEDTVFSLPELRLGQSLSWGGTPLLIKEIGAARAREMVMMCREMTASRAEHIGLLHKVVSSGSLEDEVQSWCSEVLNIPQVSFATAKSQFEGYARSARLADLTETDSDIFLGVPGVGDIGR